MTAQTPVRLWDPALARRSLPNGMPLPEQPELRNWTHLDTEVVRGLSSGGDDALWAAKPTGAAYRICEIYPEDAPTFITTPDAISADLRAALAQLDTPSRDQWLRWIVRPATATPAAPTLGQSAGAIRGAVDQLRQDLRLSARAVAELVGLSTRRYYEFRAGEDPPADRLAQIRDRVDFITRLVTRDLGAAAELCRRHTTDVAERLSNGRLTEIEDLFGKTMRERATMFVTRQRPAFSSDDAKELLGFVQGSTFGKILSLISYIAPTVDAKTAERVGVTLRLEKNLKAVEHGDPVEDDWDFLLVMPPDAINGLRERADRLVRSETFDPDSWAAFVTTESERAWAAFSYNPAGPADVGLATEDEPRGTSMADWQPNLGALGVDLSLFDRRTR